MLLGSLGRCFWVRWADVSGFAGPRFLAALLMFLAASAGASGFVEPMLLIRWTMLLGAVS
jgi:hypothetical protein